MQDKSLSLEMARTAYAALSAKKGQEIVVIDISEISSIADYFVIAHGNNVRQVQAMADEVELKMKDAGFIPGHIEGYQNANWILMDYKDIAIHVFSADDRAFYDLERIWQEGKKLTEEELA
ncbi:MAG: ribosome silencing factor [Lachnospiraceae bacterium]|nr:ribosome silencing factor [Lachnospiraceae bacterium]MBQ3401588.1 ribosome silencing factor [Lachnospiraceae bacterium]MBQ4309606.1 ribosome silencing factor [Lachnospiraceae bacterium]MBQ9464015.1 ribosome silencing factor [Lachnospiraceae bacterium]MBR0107317.1 ribosome silencing factor [Lachnospiraceae bacterium]